MPPEGSGDTQPPGAADDIRARLRRGLVVAMKARDRDAVAALRSTLAAIDNAEAVDAEAVDAKAVDSGAVDAGTVHAGAVEGQRVDGQAVEGGAAGAGVEGEPVHGGAVGAEPVDGEAVDGRAVRGQAVGGGPALDTGEGHPPVAGSVLGLRAAEAERRVLTQEDVAAIVRDEVTEREVAADVLERSGRPDQAERLRAQAKLLTTYLDPPGPPPSGPDPPGPLPSGHDPLGQPPSGLDWPG